jgi:FKBP-type peptidyl-prolyl cis-trans isomerase
VARGFASALSLVAAAALFAGCAAAVPPPDATSFAPALAVDTAGMVRLPSGLRFRELALGTGAPAATARRVEILYGVWLPDGTQVDALIDRDAPLGFAPGTGAVVRGLDEAVRGMRVGGRRQVIVPPALGYGSRRVGAVPANATLVFVVELVGAR